MSFIYTPNLPEARVRLAAADGRITQQALERLQAFGIEIIKTERLPGVYEAIAYHPDIMLHHIGEDEIVFAPGTGTSLLRLLSERGFKLVAGETEPGAKYPGDIAYNAARVGGFYFHNLKYTDPVLKRELEKRGIEPIHVNQGYSKCSISLVDAKSIITADKGIANAAEARGIEALLLPCRQNIILPGLDSGFIGGSSGLIGPEEWAVNGELRTLASSAEISSFLARKQKRAILLTEGNVMDIGSILPLLTDTH